MSTPNTDRVDAAMTVLLEHFDAVQIMVTWQENGLTKNICRGSGNWYARQGMAHEFINADIAQENARQLAEELNDEPPDDIDLTKPST